MKTAQNLVVCDLHGGSPAASTCNQASVCSARTHSYEAASARRLPVAGSLGIVRKKPSRAIPYRK